jgi:hypothetical protein
MSPFGDRSDHGLRPRSSFLTVEGWGISLVCRWLARVEASSGLPVRGHFRLITEFGDFRLSCARRVVWDESRERRSERHHAEE